MAAEIRRDPCFVMRAVGLEPEPWQARLLRTGARRILMLCSRQSGKSQTAGAMALNEILGKDRALCLILSGGKRQAEELLGEKIIAPYRQLGKPMPLLRQSMTEIALANGSRAVALPATEKTVRVYAAVDLLILDEAARVPDDLYKTVRPMVAKSRGRIVALSSAFVKQGWFYNAWRDDPNWHKVSTPAGQCSWLTDELLAEERAALGVLWYRMEYECEFMDVVSPLFSDEHVKQAMSSEVKAWRW